MYCLVLTVVSSDQGSARNLFDLSSVPLFAFTDTVELYHLQSFPLLLINTAAGAFTIKTSGLALRSTLSSQTVVFEFKPLNFSACYLPVIETYENITTVLWDKRAGLAYTNEIDTTYWQQSTFLARLNGIAYQRYVKWIDEYTRQNRYFIPQSICSSVDRLSCYSLAETWETFLKDRYVMVMMVVVVV